MRALIRSFAVKHARFIPSWGNPLRGRLEASHSLSGFQLGSLSDSHCPFCSPEGLFDVVASSPELKKQSPSIDGKERRSRKQAGDLHGTAPEMWNQDTGSVGKRRLKRNSDAEESLREKFKRWMAEYGKVYRSEDEKAFRFKMFKNCVEEVESRNKEGGSCTYGLNKFSDQAPGEVPPVKLSRAHYIKSAEKRREMLEKELEMMEKRWERVRKRMKAEIASGCD